MLEPRRLAARTAARFMSQTLGEAVGHTVGYRVRLDSKVGPHTRIEIVTEGILTRMLQEDPALTEIGVVIFDEFHERSLQADLGLALCRDCQQGLREDLRILVMSATLDGVRVAQVLGDAPVVSSQGKSFPVMQRYQAVAANPAREFVRFYQEVSQAIVTALRDESGSVLVFLPGAGEIRQVEKNLQALLNDPATLIVALSGQLESRDQDTAIAPAPAGKRKVVLATSIAETSLTIEGIRVVIDTGLSRVPRFDPNTGLTQLVTVPVSQAAADQRCGRAGRLQAGVCYRLWHEHTHLLPFSSPEILEADLAPLLLELAQWGVQDAAALTWLDPPPAPHLAQAQELLKSLNALDNSGRITAHGRAMAAIGMHPRLAHMILRGQKLGLTQLACELAAIISERDVLRGDVSREADIQLRVEILRGLQDNTRGESRVDQGAVKRARDSATQWLRHLHSKPSSPDNGDLSQCGVLLSFAYPDRIAQRRPGSDRRYVLSNGRGALLREAEPLAAHDYLVAAHLDGANEARIFLAASLQYEDLLAHHADAINERNLVEWDNNQHAVISRQQQSYGKLILRDHPWQQADATSVQQALLQGIRQQGLACLPWSDDCRQLQARVALLHQLFPDDWPDWSDSTLLESLAGWLGPYLHNMTRLTQLKSVDLQSVLLAQLPWEQQRQLNELAPTHLDVPSGSRIRVDYSQSPPVLAVRIQEMFGLADTPRLARGKIAVLLHLLSPSRRPVQITRDLAGFWRSSYHEVKKELKGRYPKHYWPDDPMQAEPTNRARRPGK